MTTFTYDTAGNLTKKNMTAGTKVPERIYTGNSRGQVLSIDGPDSDSGLSLGFEACKTQIKWTPSCNQ